MRRHACILAAYVVLSVAGCSVSKNIIDLTPPAGQTPLTALESSLDYRDPDAGRPDYVRAAPK